ncbi:MAG TPA: aquaporin [Pilimelia sp.]|nr:aquaporin [Pilimelia sp.]
MSASLPRRLVAEVIGTFLLVGLGAGAFLAATASGAGSVLLLVALGHALGLAVGIHAFGAISGAHFNPSVTIALAATRRLPPVEALFYIGAQLVGGILGALMLWATFGSFGIDNGLGQTAVAAPYSLWQGAVAEVVGTFVLVLAIFALAVDPRGPKALVGLGIGFALGAAILTFGPISGASLNFARTLGPELVTAFGGGSTHWDQILLYLIAPPIGALIAAFGYEYLARPRGVEAAPEEAIVAQR